MNTVARVLMVPVLIAATAVTCMAGERRAHPEYGSFSTNLYVITLKEPRSIQAITVEPQSATNVTVRYERSDSETNYFPGAVAASTNEFSYRDAGATIMLKRGEKILINCGSAPGTDTTNRYALYFIRP